MYLRNKFYIQVKLTELGAGEKLLKLLDEGTPGAKEKASPFGMGEKNGSTIPLFFYPCEYCKFVVKQSKIHPKSISDIDSSWKFYVDFKFKVRFA